MNLINKLSKPNSRDFTALIVVLSCNAAEAQQSYTSNSSDTQLTTRIMLEEPPKHQASSTHALDIVVASASGEITKEVIITSADYPYLGAKEHAWGGTENTTSVQEGDATEHTHVIVNGGFPKGVYGGNYGNEGGASFTGSTLVEVLTDTPIFITGASRLTSDESSLFDGSTQVIVKTILSRPNANGADFGYIYPGHVGGGFAGHDMTSASDGVQRYSTITGSTDVLLDMQGVSGRFDSSVAGGSVVYSAVDSKILGGTTLSISNAQGVSFSSFVMGGDYNFSGSNGLAMNQGNNKSDTYNKSSQLLIDSGTFSNAVFAGSFTAGGGDVISESSRSEVTGGTFNSFFVAGHGSAMAYFGSKQDKSAGAMQLGQVEAHLSDATFNYTLIGGHFMSSLVTSYDSSIDTFIGDITLNLGGYDSRGNAKGGSYTTIYGGTYNYTNADIHVTQGAVEIHLNSGLIKSNADLYAGGATANKGSVTGESTAVHVGSDFEFGSSVDVYGGFANSTSAQAGSITGIKLLSFADSQYENLGSTTTFYDFDEVHVTQSSAHADLEGETTLVTLDSEHLTKSGVGKAEVEAGDGRGTVLVKEGTMQINTERSSTGTAGTLQIQSAGHALTEYLTIARDEIASAGLSVNDVTGSGLIEAQQMVVKQEWKQSQLDAIAHESFSMISGADVHLETLTTRELIMDDGAHLHTEGLLSATHISIDDYTRSSTASSPFITASDMVSAALDNVFTYDFSSETIDKMMLDPELPYLVADLGEEAFLTAADKAFVFQIDGIGSEHTQIIDGTTYYLGTMGEDVYIYAFADAIPEPSKVSLSLIALMSMLGRRRRFVRS